MQELQITFWCFFSTVISKKEIYLSSISQSKLDQFVATTVSSLNTYLSNKKMTEYESMMYKATSSLQ